MSLPETIGPYHILRELGRGGMGVVYEAEPAACAGARYALKLLLSQDPRARERLRREGELLCRVDRHPNVVRVHATGEDRGRPYLVLDLVVGETLGDTIARGPQPWRAAVALIEPVARALTFVHAQGLIHRDVKPSNILIDRSPGEEGRPRLTDFGIAHAEEFERLTRTGAVVGTGEYLAPEQMCRGAEPDRRSDIYSLGICLHELLTGRRPFLADSLVELARMTLAADPPPPSSHVPGIPRALDRIVLGALTKDPAKRYQDADALARDLHALLAGEQPPSDRARRLRRGTIGLVLVLAAGLAAFALLQSPANDPLAAFADDLEHARRELEASHADTALARAASIAHELEVRGEDSPRRTELLASARAIAALAKKALAKPVLAPKEDMTAAVERAIARAWRERGRDDPLSFNPFGDLDGLVRKADRVYEALAEARRLAPECELPKALPRFIADTAHACFARHEYERGVPLAQRAVELDTTLHFARNDASYALLHAIDPPRPRLARDLAEAVLADPNADRFARQTAWKDALFSTLYLDDRAALRADAVAAIREFPEEPTIIEFLARQQIVDRDPAALATTEKLLTYPLEDRGQEVFRRRLHAYALLVCAHKPRESLAELVALLGPEPWDSKETTAEDFVQAGRAKLQLGDRAGARDELARSRKMLVRDQGMGTVIHDFEVELGR